MEKCNFQYSLMISQKIVDVLVVSSDKNGISHIAQGDMENEVGISRRNIRDRIDRLNWLDKCIEVLPNSGGYKVCYSNISERGTYFEIKKLIDEYKNGKILLTDNDKSLSEKYKIDIRIVYAFKTFVRMENKERELENN